MMAGSRRGCGSVGDELGVRVALGAANPGKITARADYNTVANCSRIETRRAGSIRNFRSAVQSAAGEIEQPPLRPIR
jgi:hypothetical protein